MKEVWWSQGGNRTLAQRIHCSSYSKILMHVYWLVVDLLSFLSEDYLQYMSWLNESLVSCCVFSFQIVYGGPQLHHPYGLAYFDHYIYWTEFQKGTVHRKKLSTEEDTTETLSEEFSSLFEIRVYDNTSQTGGS